MSDSMRLTETKNPRSENIDERSTLEILQIINEEDKRVAGAVERALPDIAAAVECIADRMRRGGRLIYVGAGTSGRLGILDAYECPPTFGTDPALVRAVIAGSSLAMEQAVEDGEDDVAEAKAAMEALQLRPVDAVVGITASGATPFVISAAEEARRRGAACILVTNNAESPRRELFDVNIALLTGPEVLAGSTRMKAGTAQKMALNMLSTCVMIRLGKVYDGYMVDMQPSNQKLRERAAQIVAGIAGCDPEVARTLLPHTDWSIGAAVLCAKYSLSEAEAAEVLARHDRNLRHAMRELEGRTQCGT